MIIRQRYLQQITTAVLIQKDWRLRMKEVSRRWVSYSSCTVAAKDRLSSSSGWYKTGIEWDTGGVIATPQSQLLNPLKLIRVVPLVQLET
jgi:hypothetical protein